MRIEMLRALAAATLLCAAAHAAAATTWVVDEAFGPGAHFTSIAPAIAAANNGDVVVIRAGTYDPFVLDKGLTLLGEPGARVRHSSWVTNLASDERAVIVDLALSYTLVDSCTGSVIFDGVTIDESYSLAPSSAEALLHVWNAKDVRLHRTTVTPRKAAWWQFDGLDAVLVEWSRVEFARCYIRGAEGYKGDCGDGIAGFGGDGIVCVGVSRVHVALSAVFGGDGGDSAAFDCGVDGGDGGDAIRNSGGQVIVAGVPFFPLRGGSGGTTWFGDAGANGRGVASFAGGSLRYSGATIQGGIVGPATLAVPADPTLELIAAPAPGEIPTVRLYAPTPGTARLQIGNQPLLTQDVLAAIELLVNRLRLVALGQVPASGFVDATIAGPLTLPRGHFRMCQGLAYSGSTLTGRTNSMPIIAR